MARPPRIDHLTTGFDGFGDLHVAWAPDEFASFDSRSPLGIGLAFNADYIRWWMNDPGAADIPAAEIPTGSQLLVEVVYFYEDPEEVLGDSITFGDSSAGSDRDGATKTKPPPYSSKRTPFVVTILNHTVTPGKIRIEWSSNPVAKRYKVWTWAMFKGKPAVPFSEFMTQDTFHEIRHTINGATYHFQVEGCEFHAGFFLIGSHWRCDEWAMIDIPVIDGLGWNPGPSKELPVEGQLVGGDTILARDGRVELRMGDNGNLFLYHDGEVVWDTVHEAGSAVPGSRLVMQADGNLVLYGPDVSVIWASNTEGNPGAVLRLQGDGMLVIYVRRAVWAANRNYLPPGPAPGILPADHTLASGASISDASGRVILQMQGDGNLVLRHDGVPRWATGTFKSPGSWAIMQMDSNLVLYSSAGYPLWATYSLGHPEPELAVQGDGNLVIYALVPIWARGRELD